MLKDSTKYLVKHGRVTKSILNLNGRLFIDVLLKSPNGFTSREIGEAQGNMRLIDRHSLSAELNSVYKHIKKGGKSGAKVIKLYDYWIIYFDTRLDVKRVKVRGKYRSITRLRGRIVSNDNWSFKRTFSLSSGYFKVGRDV